MPEIRPERIINCGGEDKAFPAENLLKVSAFAKWKCEEAGAKQAVVTFKFDRDYQFERIDIGNEGSAFVEVLVSRSSMNEPFEVLLPSSSFMSPADAKSGTSLNRVRIFSGDELVKAVAKQKWDVVKVVCIQPFNKSIQFGLSFIRFYHTKECEDHITPSDMNIASQLTEDPVSNGEDILKPGALFNIARKSSIEEPSTLSQKLIENNNTYLKKKHSDAPFAKDESLRGSVIPHPETQPSVSHGTSAENDGKGSTSTERHKAILSGVVVAFSGYQNPFRSELRTLCLRLGAKYRPDWDDRCTHLICACPNTPKFRLVRGKGIIVSHKWIKACDAAKKKISWRSFRVGRAPSPVGHVSDDSDTVKEESSDWEESTNAEEEEDEWKPGNSDVESDDNDSDSVSIDSTASVEGGGEISEEDDISDGDGGSTRRLVGRSKKDPAKRKRKQKTSTKNSAEVWEPIRRKRKTSADTAKPLVGTKEDNDEDLNESAESHHSPLPDLPDIFPGKKFFIFTKDLPDKEEAILRRLIIAFAGEIENYMSKDVNFIIARVSWCDDFDDALNVNQDIVFVKPEWIYACDKAAKFVPYQRFQIID